MNEESDVNLGKAGLRCDGFFGFCDIRQFTVTSQCLDEQIINFINTIAEIVHGVADQYSGYANRNIGDAFLIVWEFPKYFENRQDSIAKYKPEQRADMALISFMMILAEI